MNREVLRQLAAKYIWWKTPEIAIAQPERVLAQVMDLGDYADVELLTEHAAEDVLRDVLRHAQVGQFSERSWHYWHYRLAMATLGHVPPLPQRVLH